MSDLGTEAGYETIAGSFDEANERNIPVGVSISEADGHYELRADNYKPFKDEVDQWYYGARADSPEPLQHLVTEKVLPLYELALESLKGIAAGTSDHQQWYSVSPQAQGDQSQE